MRNRISPLLVIKAFFAVLAGLLILSALLGPEDVWAADSSGSGENPIFVDTHLLPSPLTLPGGAFQAGTFTAYGITGFLQIGTDVLSDVFQIPNVSAKLGLLDFPGMALALTMQWENYNLNSFNSSNPDLRIAQWMPGAVAGFAVLPEFALFLGGNLDYASLSTPGSVSTSGYVQGSGIESDVAWSYSPGYAVSAGATYDLTYKIYGIGISHHWPGLQLGIHYYPDATDDQWRPIIAGGVATNF